MYINIIVVCFLPKQKMASYDTGYEDERFQHPVGRGFHCCICTNVIKDPVMCHNEHIFCRACITRHLMNSQTCPTCREPLTVESLQQASRTVTNLLSELQIRCQFFERGCTQFVELGNLERHVSDCGFAPAVCSNEGCQLEVNKQDLLHHETTVCEQRRVVCHSCNDIRREMNVMKVTLAAMNEKLDKNEKNIEKKMAENQENLKSTEQNIKTVVEKVELVQIQLNQQKENNRLLEAETKKSLSKITDLLKTVILQTSPTEDAKKGIAEADGVHNELKVIVAGGENKNKEELGSVEMFSLSTRTWALLQPMRECRRRASSVVYNNEFIVIGGKCKKSIEKLSLNTVESGPSITWENVPTELTGSLYGHDSVIYNGRLIVIGGSSSIGIASSNYIIEISMLPPYTSKLLATMPESTYFHGVAIFGDKIMIVGVLGNRGTVLEYDITENVFRRMNPLPYHVHNMAMIKWDDNFIVLGGWDKKLRPLSKVLMYNIKSEKSYMLPEMLTKRSGCVAAVVNDTVIVIGGKDEDGNFLKSVESFRFDRFTWEELPEMKEERFIATAGVVC